MPGYQGFNGAIQQLIPGIQNVADGTIVNARGGKQGEQMVSELHGRFYEQNYRGNVYSTGPVAIGAISTATFNVANGSSGTLATAAASTPVIGLWNPLANNVNAVILQATIGVIVTAATNTGCGGFLWVGFTGQSSITVASQLVPVNRKSLLATGSACKGVSGLALTGLTNLGAVLGASALNGGSAANFSFVGTAVGEFTVAVTAVENLDGNIIIPPGGILGLYTGSTAVAHSAVVGLTWEEVPA